MLRIDLKRLLDGCSDESFDAGIKMATDLQPLSGPTEPVKPAVYAGGQYQLDKRFANTSDAEPTPVIVIDNVPSQANRLEEALRRNREPLGLPEFILDLAELGALPSHVLRSLSSFQFPHRNADAYLRDSTWNGTDFLKTKIGQSIFGATAGECGPLMSWFPQALLYGFWQSHLGKKRHNSKHARAWVSEIVGWNPAGIETRTLGLKGDPLNLNIDEDVRVNSNDLGAWSIGKGKGAKADNLSSSKLSGIGHGQTPFTGNDAALAAVSFQRVTQLATVSFAQLRRVSLGSGTPPATDAAARALLVAMGLHAHRIAFERAFSLRSGADLRPQSTIKTWLGVEDEPCEVESTDSLLQEAKAHALEVGVPLAGWDQPATVLKPKSNLAHAIRSTWPESTD